jgi:hypothetical protein
MGGLLAFVRESFGSLRPKLGYAVEEDPAFVHTVVYRSKITNQRPVTLQIGPT